jgi:regulatory protein
MTENKHRTQAPRESAAEEGAARSAKGGQRRQPKPATYERLEKAAYAYLERYAASRASLRRVLMRRVERSARLHGTDREEATGWVEAILESFTRSGLLDDQAYARMQAASLRRQGRSARQIQARLAEKGVDRDLIETALEETDAEDPAEDSETAAAVAYARRRALGPFNRRGDRAARRERDLAAMGRAGYDLAIARAIIDAADSDEADALPGTVDRSYTPVP